MTRLVALAVLLFSACIAAAVELDPSILNSRIDLKIDLTTQNVKLVGSIKVENTGKRTVTEYLLAHPASQQLAYISVLQGRGKAAPGLTVEPVSSLVGAPSNVTLLKATLAKPLAAGATTSLEVYMVLTGLLEPKPAEIQQNEEQLLLFRGSAYFLSPYLTRSHLTVVKCPSMNVKSYTRNLSLVKKSGSEITYGPFEDVGPFRVTPIEVHFESNKPFVVASSLDREFEISHWGNIYIKDDYDVSHVGAKHKSSFSRLEFQARPSASSVRDLVARLPLNAHSIYFRDEIGNVSTSTVRFTARRTEVEFQPRYPLVGGWRTVFTIGYGVPLHDFVFTSRGGRLLNITLGSPIAELVVKELTVKVVLPEGAYDISVVTPFAMRQSQEVKKTYLDTTGRPVVVLKMSNVVADHDQYFQVKYRFSALAMVHEPLLLVGAFLLFFLACMAYMRLDLTISKSSPAYQARQQREEVLDALQRIQKTVNGRTAAADKLEMALKELALGGDATVSKKATKLFEEVVKETTLVIKDAVDALEAAKSPNALEKAKKLVEKQKEREAVLNQLNSATTAILEKKGSASELDSKTAPLAQKLVSLKQELKGLLAGLVS